MWDDDLPDVTPGENRRMRRIFEKVDNSAAVYYHDHFIGMPAAWDNAWFTPVRVTTTPHFAFYRVHRKSTSL